MINIICLVLIYQLTIKGVSNFRMIINNFNNTQRPYEKVLVKHKTEIIKVLLLSKTQKYSKNTTIKTDYFRL